MAACRAPAYDPDAALEASFDVPADGMDVLDAVDLTAENDSPGDRGSNADAADGSGGTDAIDGAIDVSTLDAGSDVAPPIDTGPDSGTYVPMCLDAGAATTWDGSAPTLATDIQPIFDAHCSCHTTGQIPSLLAGMTYDSIVCRPALVGCPGASAFVLPGDPSQSAVYLRVAGRCYDQMPLGAAPLSATELSLIYDWIASGANP